MKPNSRLIDKYNVPVPRYTSYPPANHFDQQLSGEKYVSLIASSNDWKPAHIAFYVHFPFCKKICHYCGCNTSALRNDKMTDQYMEALKSEIAMVTAGLDKSRMVTQVHFGGGTPNLLPVASLKEIVDLFRASFPFSPNAELAIECHPAHLDEKYLEGLMDAGFNRISLGIQDFDPNVLQLVNRETPALPVHLILEILRSLNSKVAVNLDFIYGLPGQSPESFLKSLQQAVELQPDRLVTFSYAHVPWLKKHQQMLEKIGLPNTDEKTEMFLTGYNFLTNTGYRPIGLDHFVRENDELYKALENKMLHRNFQGYCTRETTGQVYAFGSSAISQFERAYIQNTRSIPDYIGMISSGRFAVENGLTLTSNHIIIREVITRLMCNKYVRWDEVASEFNLNPAELQVIIRYDENQLRMFRDDGILEFTTEEVKVTEAGNMFIRNIASSFDPDYAQQVNKYSKSV